MVSVTIQSRPSSSSFVPPLSSIAGFALLASLILAACAGPQVPSQPPRQAEDSSGQPAPSIQQAGEAREAPTPPSDERPLALVPPLPLAALDVRQPARSAEREEAAPVVEAKPVFVTAQRESYAVERAATATKSDQPIMETPVSIQVVPRAVMDDQQVISVGDALKNVSGVQPGGYTFYDNFILRGFEANASTYRNGLRHQATTALETANLDVIEVLKGPASVLYGRTEPGGLVNLATKRPLDVPYYSLQQQFGSYNFYRTTLDATGPLLADRTLLYRVNLAYKNNNTFQDLVTQHSIFFAPSLTWRPNSRFESNLDIEYQRNTFTDVSDIGIPAVGNRPAPIPLSRFTGDPAAKNTQRRVLVGLDWTYRFNPEWKIINRFQFNDVAYDQRTLFAVDFDQSTGELTRGLWHADLNRRTYAANLDLVGHVRTGPIKHDLLVGVDYYRFEGVYSAFAGQTPAVPSFNIFNPSYGIDLSSITRATYNQFGTFPEQWYGLYFQDQITLWDKVHILGGGRYDWAEVGTSFSDTSLALAHAGETNERTGYFSPRLGIVYRPWQWLSLYGNYVKSLGSNNSGTPLPGSGSLDPQTARQWEAGIKTEFFGGRVNSTLAFFDLTKENVATVIPGTPFSRTIGEANSRGVEFDVSGRLTDQLNVIASYAYTDAKVTKDLSGIEGNRLISVPAHSGSLWAVYEFTDGILQGVRLGTGAFARSTRMADLDNTVELPGYVRWDASAGYTFTYFGPKMTAQLNVYNLLNTDYYDRGNSRLVIQPGLPLTFLGSLRIEM
ncbi:MAG: TonB-dependent siderophore receptor [Nitrospira sp.]|nr:TonB-dependent siderophore receptor [Nitrospira sp.]